MPQVAAYKGFETFYNALRMNAKMVYVTCLLLVFFHALLTLVIAYLTLGPEQGYIAYKWSVASVISPLFPEFKLAYSYDGQVYNRSAEVLTTYLAPYVVSNLKQIGLNALITGCLVYFFSPFFIYGFVRRSANQFRRDFVKGAKAVSPAKLRRMVRRRKPDIPLGEIKLPHDLEPQHVFFVGAPGTGKTVLQTRVVDRVIERGSPAIIYDFKGDFVAKFFRPGVDILFNPLDKRCGGWNLFNEVEMTYDIDSMSASLIPPAINTDPFWNDAARDVFAGILHYLYQNDMKTNKDIWRMVTMDIRDLSESLRGVKGAERGWTYIQDASSKQAMSVHAVLMQYAKSFEFMQSIQGDFSVREWIKKPEGNIYITNYSHIKETLRPILSLFIDLIGRVVLSLPDDRQRRIFFFLDEFGTLQRLSTIVNLLTLGRSKGASCWVGIQDIGQLDRLYTDKHRQAIINACGNSVIFRVSEPTTAKFLSDKIGSSVWRVADEVYSMGVADNRDGVSISKREHTEALVMPSELQNLPDLHGYVKFVGYPIVLSKFKPRNIPEVNPEFVKREDLSLENIRKEQTTIEARAAKVLSPGRTRKKGPGEKEKNGQNDLFDRELLKELREQKNYSEELLRDEVMVHDEMADISGGMEK